MKPKNFEQAVFDRWGRACVVCSRTPNEWLETDFGDRSQDKLSFHHVNGDDDDDRIENVIPVCQSCHKHIHRVDEPPYRKWHRQLPIEHRNAWNEHYQEYYEGPRLTRDEAERRFSDDEGVPESIKYLKHEREDFDPSAFTSTEEGELEERTDTGSDEPTADTDDIDSDSDDVDPDDDSGSDLND